MTPGAAACTLAAIVVTFAITCIFVIVTRRDQERYEPRHDHTRRLEVHHEGPPPFIREDFPAALPAAGLLPMTPVRPPDDTQPIPHAVGTWGMPRHELLDHLARTHMEATR